MECNWNLDLTSEREDHPVNCMEWRMAKEHCQVWMGGDLPTEWQWEKAARGTDARHFPWGSELPSCERCNVNSCSSPESEWFTWPAGYLESTAGDSPYGLKDMCGNVQETTRSSFDNVGQDLDPEAVEPLDFAVPRGWFGWNPDGDWEAHLYATYLRSMFGLVARRMFSTRTGYRCVRETP